MPDLLLERITRKAIFLDAYRPVPTFAVVSWGAAVTSWLAWALNSHPDIYCVHAANQFWRALGDAPLLDGLDYINLLASQGSAYRVAGDVHGVSRHTIPAIRQELGDAFRAAVLIRDPLPRLRSQFAMHERYRQHRIYDLAYVDGLIDRLDLPVSKDDYVRKLHVHGINMLNAITEEVDVGPIFRSEEITSDPEAFAGIARAIAGDEIEIDSDWCRRVVASQPRNSHNQSKTDSLAEPWMRDLIARIVQPQAWELYEKLGYPPPVFIG